MFSKNTTLFSKNTTSRGEKIRVKLFGGNIVDRIVWEIRDEGVEVCTVRSYESLLAGTPIANPVLFPFEYVYQS